MTFVFKVILFTKKMVKLMRWRGNVAAFVVNNDKQ